MAAPLVATMPQRQGVAIALIYLPRVYFRDPSDDLPPPRGDEPRLDGGVPRGETRRSPSAGLRGLAEPGKDWR